MKTRILLAGCAVLIVAAVAWLWPRAGDAAAPPVERDLDPGATLEQQTARIGPLTPDAFAARYPAPEYLPKLRFDPTAAKYFAEFDADPLPPGKPGRFVFRLDDAERAAFRKNGFVVSERLGAASFSQMLYRVYSRDLPVYLSADALLHAWHRSYDAMLEELEEAYLSATLTQILHRMAAAVPALHREHGAGPLAESVTDADYYLTVALSLLGRGEKSSLGQQERVEMTLAACDAQRMEKIDLFGRVRVTDFTQFKPRGHYEKSDTLRRYFRAMMWCGRIDLRVAGPESSARELGAAAVLHDLLRRAGQFDRWQEFDRLLQTFVGRTDSMTFAQLGGLLKAGGIKGPADVTGPEVLEGLRRKILAGKVGLQQIQSDYYEARPLGSIKTELPRSFTVLGQKFTLDSWVTSQVVFDRVIHEGEKVQRRVPSALDVAFAALGNDATVPTLVARMKDQGGRKFRDGLPYQQTLAAVRDIIDAQPASSWDESLYAGWLATLRELSRPAAEGVPEVARTEAWARKSLNTQLASWAQLRHDTILYVKQSYTFGSTCIYPAGYVEPVPAFWGRFERMARRAADLLERTPFPDRSVQRRQVDHLRQFAKNLAVIKGIATKQLAQQELTKEETAFLRKVVEQKHLGSGGPHYTGWYFGMFYKGAEDADRWDALVADVHTNVPTPILGDPGCVLHQGVGSVDFLLVAVDSGKDRMVYGGPVLSHYEFEMPGVSRLSDSEWRKRLRDGKPPPRPEWTRAYLVPGVNPEAKRYKHVDDK